MAGQVPITNRYGILLFTHPTITNIFEKSKIDVIDEDVKDDYGINDEKGSNDDL